MHQLTYADIEAARDRGVHHRPVTVTQADPGTVPGANVWLALEYMQHTGSFKARGAANFLAAHRNEDALSKGVTIASGGNAGLACAWAAEALGVHATVFLPTTAPQIKVNRLRSYGAEVRLVGKEYAEAAAACQEFAATSGALVSHAYDHPLIAAGAGTLLEEIHSQIPDLDTIVVAVGGGGLLAGVATAAAAPHHRIRTVGAEPEHCCALTAAIKARRPVDVAVDSIAADSLGARRTSAMALHAARQDNARAVLVQEPAIIRARQALWDHRRLAVEHGAATALAALTGADDIYGYRPAPGETVCVVLCGANTDPSDLVAAS